MKSGFTLIEILVALVIVGILVGTAVVSFGAGVKSAQMADATRAVQQCASHARAIALLKQRPVVLTFEEIVEDGTFVKSRISASYSKDAEADGAGASGGAGFGVAGGAGGRVLTLSGQPVGLDEPGEEGEDAALDDPLSSEPRDFPGIHIRCQQREELEQRRS
ncbi:MAG: Tfp pilus assembly protein FimT/FimU, partial [Kiritimatiellia bacterium]